MEFLKAAEVIIREKVGRASIGLILGSGLGALTDEVAEKKEISYENIPGFAKSTVPGHSGKLISGLLSGRRVLILSGRIHYYEGHPMEKIVFMIDSLKASGVEKIIITNAAGSVRRSLPIPSLMLIKDHINFMGTNPLIGGPHFVDMTNAYDEAFLQAGKRAAKSLKMKVWEGVYLALPGPSYETKAEIKMFKKLGADAVGMSTVPEVIAANKNGMKVLGISCLTNYAAGILKKPLSHEEVIESGKKIARDFANLIKEILVQKEFD